MYTCSFGLTGTIMLRIKPVYKKAWVRGIRVVCLIPSILTGGVCIIGFILGFRDGANAFSSKT